MEWNICLREKWLCSLCVSRCINRFQHLIIHNGIKPKEPINQPVVFYMFIGLNQYLYLLHRCKACFLSLMARVVKKMSEACGTIMSIHIYIYIYMCVRACVCMCVCVYLYIYIYTCVCGFMCVVAG